MKQTYLKVITSLITIATFFSLPLSAQDGEFVLRYFKPAGIWEESLPLGKGYLGITVFGGVQRERIQLSEHSIYRGGGTASRKLDPLVAEYREEKRRIAVSGNEVETDYERTLDLNTATAITTFEIDDAIYTREVFCSFPDDIPVMKISCSEKDKISFNAKLSRQTDLLVGRWNSMVNRMINGGASRYVDPVIPKIYGEDDIGFTGWAIDEGTRFSAVLKTIATGGKMDVKNNCIYVENTDEVILIFSASTDYYHPENRETFALNQVNAASKKSYDELLEAYLADYQKILQPWLNIEI